MDRCTLMDKACHVLIVPPERRRWRAARGHSSSPASIDRVCGETAPSWCAGRGAGGTVGTTERTLVLVKPDGVRRGLTGEIFRRIEAKGYRFVTLELRAATRALLERHYFEHVGKPFYEPLVEF